ncbi:MAG: hypothetical protein FJ164_04950 [Gammaproteobacteria bacterium]|nr:hypothetical protein [Gammaproteobacteria bacterium]
MSYRLSPETLPGWSPVLMSGGLLVLTLVHHLAGTEALNPDTSVPEPMPVATGPAARPVNLERLREWSLFGKSADAESDAAMAGAPDLAAAVVLPEEDENTVLPATALDVKVQGIAYSRDRSRAYAILQVEGGAPREFRPGEPLKEGVELRAIRPLEVVIKHQGRLESAALPVAPGPMTSEEESTDMSAGAGQGRPTPFSILGGDQPPGSWRRLDSLRGAPQ